MKEMACINCDVVSTITITKEDYDFLQACYWDLSIIKDAIFKNADLAWSKKRLSIDTDVLVKVIALVAPETYRDTLKRLQKEDEAKEEEKNGSDSSEE